MAGPTLTAADRRHLLEMSDKIRQVRGTTPLDGPGGVLRAAAEQYGPLVLDLLARGVSKTEIVEASGVASWSTVKARLERHNLVKRPRSVAEYRRAPLTRRGPACGHDPSRFVSRTRKDGREFIDCLECKRNKMNAARAAARKPTIPRGRRAS